MKLGKCQVTNFGSYKSLSFDFADQGLALIYGSTGAGKSTLEDIAAWILFGVTAKNGNADEIKNWTTPNELTTGKIEVIINDNLSIEVFRQRGKANQNDLFWQEGQVQENKRGKDLSETQKLLEARLGISANSYLTSAYFHEFSTASTFFIAKAGDRKKMFESIANLDFPNKLIESLKKEKKIIRADIDSKQREVDIAQALLKQHNKDVRYAADNENAYDVQKTLVINELKQRIIKGREITEAEQQILEERKENFEVLRHTQIEHLVKQMLSLEEPKYSTEEIEEKIKDYTNKIETLEDARCEHCGAKKSSDLRESLSASIIELKNEQANTTTHKSRCAAIMREMNDLTAQPNPYEGQTKININSKDLELLELKEAEINPFSGPKAIYLKKLNLKQCELQKLDAIQKSLNLKYSSIETLQSLTISLRGELVKKTIKDIEQTTNKYFNDFFENVLNVQFSIEGTDNIEVLIQKNGYECSYRQLSKGQRGLLKLCFSVSVMKAAANNAGLHFDTLCFDEALDGLDEDLKVKAFGLFEELSKSHSSILVIEHCNALQMMFDKRYHIVLKEDSSAINEEP